jgi:hypothetical protein
MDGSNGEPAIPFWPWPMENRILSELGIDVTGESTEILQNQNVPTGAKLPAPSISPLPPPPVTDLQPGMIELWYLAHVAVSLAGPISDGVIVTPTARSPQASTAYSEPVRLTSTTILKAKTFRGTEASHARSAYYRIDSTRINEPPRVSAAVLPFLSDYAEFVLPKNEIGLYGRCEDYTFPSPPAALSVEWSLVSGPQGGTVSFADSSKPRTLAKFSGAGKNVVQLTASDGQLRSSQTVTIMLWPQDLAGVVHRIPGRIEAENYKSGGEGVGYHSILGYGDGVSQEPSPAST